MGVNGNGRLPKGRIENDIGRFSTDTRKRFQFLPGGGHLSPMLIVENPARTDDVCRFGVVEPDGSDMTLEFA